jgi:hypothetical protein
MSGATPEMEDPIDDSENKREEKRGPESSDEKSGHENRSKHHEERVDDEREKAECQDIYREGKDEKNGADEEIKRAKDDCADKRGKWGYRNVRDDVCRDQYRESRNKPMKK